MKVTVLGTGTSTGVPVPACRCAICTSQNPKNTRLRASIYVELPNNSASGARPFGILIDTATDLRTQALRAGLSHIDAVFYTHCHADHVFGIDDLRSFNFITGEVIQIYASKDVGKELTGRFDYAFNADLDYEGGMAPMLNLHRINPLEPVQFDTHLVTPLPLFHGKLGIFGYRINNFAYLTDCSSIPEETRELLDGLDTLIIDGLRFKPHKTHFTIEQSIREIERIKPKQAYITHISHEVDYDFGNSYIRERTTAAVELCYDGLVLDL